MDQEKEPAGNQPVEKTSPAPLFADDEDPTTWVSVRCC